MEFIADGVRVAFLAATAALAMVCVKVAWIAAREGTANAARAWVPASIVMLLATPLYLMLKDFGRPLSMPYALFAVAVGCGLMGARAMFTLHTDWVLRGGSGKHAISPQSAKPGYAEDDDPQPVEEPVDDYVEVYRDNAGEWRWRYRSSNGVDTLADSGEGYKNRSDAVSALRTVTNRTPAIVETKHAPLPGAGTIRVVIRG